MKTKLNTETRNFNFQWNTILLRDNHIAEFMHLDAVLIVNGYFFPSINIVSRQQFLKNNETYRMYLVSGPNSIIL